jgi:hypothetical protein
LFRSSRRSCATTESPRKETERSRQGVLRVYTDPERCWQLGVTWIGGETSLIDHVTAPSLNHIIGGLPPRSI